MPVSQSTPCSPFPVAAHQTGRAVFPHPAFRRKITLSHVVCAVTSEPRLTLIDFRQLSCPWLLYILFPNQGPFPPPALPRFLGTTGLSATLTTQSSPRGLPVGVCATPLPGLPVLPLLSSSMRASANTPAEASRCSCRSLPKMPAAFS